MNVDYIIIGLGLAGLAFAEQLEKNKKSFIVFEDHSQNSSLVAGGMYNPVILKRFTPVWDAENQLQLAIPFYKSLEKKLKATFNYPIDIYRIFSSIEEQNNWFNACDKPFFSKYMIPKVIKNINCAIQAPFGFGSLTNTGKIATGKLLKAYRDYLEKKNQLKNERFEYTSMHFESQFVNYKTYKAKHIVFCEGFGVKKNPYFKDIPLREAKGELLTIHAPKLKIDFLLKAGVFIMPLGDHCYKVGATFNWTDKTQKPTRKGKEELLTKLKKIITVDFSIVEQTAGIRPTVKDRRPILGSHKKHRQLSILNGLGTRGVLLAPKMAIKLFDFLEHKTSLDREISLTRFYKESID